jgi:hypothetical protein
MRRKTRDTCMNSDFMPGTKYGPPGVVAGCAPALGAEPPVATLMRSTEPPVLPSTGILRTGGDARKKE